MQDNPEGCYIGVTKRKNKDRVKEHRNRFKIWRRFHTARFLKKMGEKKEYVKIDFENTRKSNYNNKKIIQ